MKTLGEYIAGAKNFWNQLGHGEQLFYIFTLFFIFFGALQWQTAFRDPDSFYHARMVEEILSHGLVRGFPWLPKTVIAINFSDHHLFYHLLILPFALVGGGLWAIKISSVLFAALAVTTLFGLLRYFRAPYPFVFTAFVGISAYGAQRLNLGKAGALALIIELLWIASAFSGRVRLAGGLAFIAVWAHGSWPMIAVLLGALVLARSAVEFLAGAEASCPASFRSALSSAWQAHRQVISATLIGLTLGNIINPYFPKNLIFDWHQIVQIAVLGGARLIRVGAEWYPLSARNMFTVSAPLIFLILAGTLIGYRALKEGTLSFDRLASERFLFCFLISALFFLMSFRSIRHVEYFFPYAVLMVATFWGFLLREKRVQELAAEWFRRFFGGAVGSVMALTLAIFLGLYLGVNVKTLFAIHHKESVSWQYLRPAAEFAARESAPGEMLYHSEWDNFPELWYWDRKNVFVSGLDARFLASQNFELANDYQQGIPTKRDFTELLRDLGARLVLIEKTKMKDAMIPVLKRDQRFVIRYEDSEAIILEWLDATNNFTHDPQSSNPGAQ